MGEETVEGEAQEDFTMVDRMRNWRNDAMTQHLYGTAQFWGSKVFGLTGNPNDAFWLAQTHLLTHQYSQAERILTTLRPTTPPSTEFASSSTPPPGSPSSSSQNGEMRRLTDTSLACRYLAAQCQVRLGKWEEALEMVGRGNGNWSAWDGEIDQGDGPGDGGIKFTASTAHLRGLIHLHLGASDLAKDSFIEALSRDVKCFESFEILVGGEMMTSEEEWEFIQGLEYRAQTGDDADFVKMMYTVRLKKIKHHDEMTTARQRLTDKFGLGDDPDVLFGLADELYTGMKFAECYKVTTKILALHSSHRPTLPLHLSCMHHLPHLRSKLFLLAHDLVENEPDDAISWYAVGMWYFSGKRWEESRRYFGKSVLIDSRFGPAWIAFAHSYAYEGEHDQAITAYSTALRHFQGTHLPLLFIGMQHLGLNNIDLAKEYLLTAKETCGDDPAVYNELGVVEFYKENYQGAIELFSKTLRLAKNVQGSKTAWSTTHLNLGHAYRKLARYTDAYRSYRMAIELEPRSAAAYSGLGLVEHLSGRHQESVARYHEALSITPGDPLISELLKLVLEEISNTISQSTNTLPFPGLRASTVRDLDSLVNALDKEILEGRNPEEGEDEGLGAEATGADAGGMSEGNTMRTDLSAMSAGSEMLEESVSMQETMDMDD